MTRNMDAETAAPDGGLHGWLSGGHYGGDGGSPLGRVRDERLASGGSGSHSFRGDVQIPIRESGIIAVLLVTSCGMGELPSESSALLR